MTLPVDFKTDLLNALSRVKQKQICQNSSNVLSSVQIPLVNNICPDLPLLSRQNWVEQVIPPKGIKDDLAIRMKGEAMLYAGICSGDIVLLKENSDPYNGQVVAVRKNNKEEDINLKFCIKKDSRTFLRSANPHYEDIELSNNHEIIGVMVGLIRESAPSLSHYDYILESNNIEDRWSKIIISAKAAGIQPEAIQNMIEMHIAMAQKISKG